MSRVPFNDVFKRQQKSLVPATFKRGVISSVNTAQGTVNVYFIENPSSNDIKQGLIYISKLDSEIQKKIGVNGKVWYFENYSENIYISKIMNVIYSLQKSSN